MIAGFACLTCAVKRSRCRFTWDTNDPSLLCKWTTGKWSAVQRMERWWSGTSGWRQLCGWRMRGILLDSVNLLVPGCSRLTSHWTEHHVRICGMRTIWSFIGGIEESCVYLIFLQKNSTEGIPDICSSSYDDISGYNYNIKLSVPYDSIDEM